MPVQPIFRHRKTFKASAETCQSDMRSLSWGSLFCSNWIYAQHHVIIIFKAKFKAKNQGKIQSKISDKNSKQNALEMLHTKYEASIKSCLEGLKSLIIQIHSLLDIPCLLFHPTAGQFKRISTRQEHYLCTRVLGVLNTDF